MVSRRITRESRQRKSKSVRKRRSSGKAGRAAATRRSMGGKVRTRHTAVTRRSVIRRKLQQRPYRSSRYSCDVEVDSSGTATATCVKLEEVQTLANPEEVTPSDVSNKIVDGENMKLLSQYEIVRRNDGKFEIGPFLKHKNPYSPYEEKVFKIHADNQHMLTAWLNGSKDYFAYPGTGKIQENIGGA